MRLFGRKSSPVTAHLEPADAEACAALHAQAFAHPWDETEFESMLAASNVEATGIWRAHVFLGFLVARVSGDEAEVLTLAVAKRTRRQGLGRRLLDANLLAVAKRGVRRIFLEVEDGNVAAMTLYRKAGFVEVGRRENYYRAANGTRAHALVLRYDAK